MEGRMTGIEKASLAILTFFMLLCMAVLLSSPSNAAEEDAKNSFELRRDDAEKAFEQALEAQDLGSQIAVKILSAREDVLFSHRRPMEIGVKTLRFDEKKRTWSGNLFVYDGEDVITALPMSGNFDVMSEVPVLSEKLRKGDVIRKEDIRMMAYPEEKIRRDTVMNAEDLVGKTPQRGISANRPIRLAELQAPHLVEKGKTVEMQFATDYIKISTLGEALEDGAEGQTIRVRNADSGTTVQAKVISADTVEVRSTTAFGSGKVASR